jgi:hypothetical protein
VKPENLLVIPSIVPDRKSIERFTKHISPMLASSQQLRAIIQNLGQTRDLLLPRLLSGQIAPIAKPSPDGPIEEPIIF